MSAFSGHKASVKITSATVTTSTDEAATLAADQVSLKIDSTAKRHWDIDSTAFPKVYDHGVSTSVPVSSTKYSVNYVQGIVTFTTPHALASTYKLDVQYVTASAVANARQWTLNAENPILDDTVFGSTWRTGMSGLRSAGASLAGFWVIGGTTAPLGYDYIDAGQRAILELYPLTTEGNRYEAYAWIASNQVQAQVDALVGETLDFTIDGALYYTTST